LIELLLCVIIKLNKRINQERGNKMSNKPNKQQQQAIDFKDGSCIVIAGAGSGKCIKGDSMIYTDKGILEIGEIDEYYNVNHLNECKSNIISYSLDAKKENLETSHWYNMGHSDTYKITTQLGTELEGTPEHPIVVLNENGDLEFKKLIDVKLEDYVATSYNNNLWGDSEKIDENMAYLLGILTADGYIKNKVSISFSNNEKEIQDWIINEIKNRYDKDIYFSEYKRKNGNVCSNAYIGTKLIRDDLYNCGLDYTLSAEKVIPKEVLTSNREVNIKFLQGMFDLESSVSSRDIELTSTSKKMIQQLQMVLLNLGIVSRIKEKVVKNYECNKYYRLTISGISMRVFRDIVGFYNNQSNTNKLNKACEKDTNTNVFVYPNIGDKLKYIRNTYYKKQPFWNGTKQSFYNGVSFKDYFLSQRRPSGNKLLEIIERAPIDEEEVIKLTNYANNLFFTKVVKKEESSSVVYDFTVPKNHSFVSNGFISHNTLVLQKRIENLVETHNVCQKDILAISFTKDSADELKKRLGAKYSKVETKTFHSLCLGILNEQGNKKDLFMLDWKFEKDFKEKFGDYYEIPKILSWISFQKNMGYVSTSKTFAQTEKELPEHKVRAFYEFYDNYLAKNNQRDFDDMLLEFVLLAKKSEKFRNSVSKRYKYIMVDEHQDSNNVQQEILKLLAGYGNMVAVADFRQAIYGFRGASVDIVLNFLSDWDNAQMINLPKNYRSTDGIVKLANGFIKQTYGSHELYSDLIAESVEEGAIIINGHLQVHNEIKRLVEEEKVNPNDIAILYRNHYLSAEYEMGLQSIGIPYVLTGKQKSFFDRPEVNTVLNYLRFALDNENAIAFGDIYNTPNRYLSRAFMQNAVNVGGNLLKAPTYKFNEKKGMDSLKEVITSIPLEACPSLAIDTILRLTKLDKLIAKQKKEGEEKAEGLGLLRKMSIQFKTIKQFLYIMDKIKKEPKKKDGVKMMTIHASKGLEFKHVFVVGADNGVFPSERSTDEEERRLFYVAITRAIEGLYVYGYGTYVRELEDLLKVY